MRRLCLVPLALASLMGCSAPGDAARVEPLAAVAPRPRSISDVAPSHATVQMAYFDPDSNHFYLWRLGQLETLPLTVVDEPLLRFDHVRAGEHVAQGLWTLFVDVPGDEMERIHRAAIAHEQVYLVWNRRIVKVFRPQDCLDVGRRYKQSVVLQCHGFSNDESAAKIIARMIRDKHTDSRKAARGDASSGAATGGR